MFGAIIFNQPWESGRMDDCRGMEGRNILPMLIKPDAPGFREIVSLFRQISIEYPFTSQDFHPITCSPRT